MDILQGVLEASPDAVLVVDEAGVVRRANRNVPAVLGYDPGEIEGMRVEELLPESEREQHVRYRQEYMEDPEPRPMGRELDLRALRADGTEVPVEIGLGPIVRDGDRYVVATITDITKRKRRERELRRQNERLEEFASIVSHDLRSPLSVAKGRLELAREECDSEHLSAIARAHARMETLIEDVLTLAREGKPVAEPETVELESVVEDCWGTAATADATLVNDVGGAILADRSRLKQLFENLFRNAVEHGSTGSQTTEKSDDVAGRSSAGDRTSSDNAGEHGSTDGRTSAGDDADGITIRVTDIDGGFRVEDDGVGIDEDERDRVFEAGYSGTEDGTGFGLAIVGEIAAAHDWDVSVGESPEGGARFDITGVEPA